MSLPELFRQKREEKFVHGNVTKRRDATCAGERKVSKAERRLMRCRLGVPARRVAQRRRTLLERFGSTDASQAKIVQALRLVFIYLAAFFCSWARARRFGNGPERPLQHVMKRPSFEIFSHAHTHTHTHTVLNPKCPHIR